jgi:hypothetical protein
MLLCLLVRGKGRRLTSAIFGESALFLFDEKTLKPFP